MHHSHLNYHLIKAEKRRNSTRMGGGNMLSIGDLMFQSKIVCA